MPARICKQIRAEKIEILVRNTSFTLVTNLLLSSALLWGLWEIADHGALIGWWAAIIALVMVRLVLLMCYRRRVPEGVIPWHTCLAVATILAGMVWGSATILFFIPESPIALVYVLSMHFAMRRSIPSAILTGDTAPDRQREARGSEYLLLHKPIRPARLRAALTAFKERLMAKDNSNQFNEHTPPSAESCSTIS